MEIIRNGNQKSFNRQFKYNEIRASTLKELKSAPRGQTMVVLNHVHIPRVYYRKNVTVPKDLQNAPAPHQAGSRQVVSPGFYEEFVRKAKKKELPAQVELLYVDVMPVEPSDEMTKSRPAAVLPVQFPDGMTKSQLKDVLPNGHDIKREDMCWIIAAMIDKRQGGGLITDGKANLFTCGKWIADVRHIPNTGGWLIYCFSGERRKLYGRFFAVKNSNTQTS